MKYTVRRIILVMTFLILFANSFNTYADTPAPLLPAAQEALNKGIVAAKVPDYLLAIRYFEEARKIAPQAPVIYLNMGLAESKIPGRELRAIAWFGAYLAAYPDAPNAAAVKEQIAVLEIKSQSNASNLIKSVQDAADEIFCIFPNGPPSNCDGCDPPKNPYLIVAELWANAGDISTALKFAGLIPSAVDKDYTHRHIASAQAKSGDIEGALKTAGLIQNAKNRGYVQRNISDAQAKIADFAGALKTTSLIQDGDNNKIYAYKEIAIAQAEKDDNQGALKTVASAQKTAELIKDESNKNYALTAIAEAQAKIGDISGAQKTADLIQNTSLSAESLSYIAEAQAKTGNVNTAKKTFTAALKAANSDKYRQYIIAKVQARSGDIAGARKSADLIKDAYWEIFAQIDIAEAQIKHGDITGAKKTFAYALTASTKSNKLVPYRIAEAQVKAGFINAWLKNLDDGGEYQYSECPLNTEPFLNLAGYFKSLPPSDNPQTIFKTLHETAEKIIRAQQVIHQMLKQEVKK